MNTADYVRDLLLTCPILADADNMQLDFVDNVGDSYSVDSLPTATEVKRYMDGGALMQFSFYLTSTRSTFSDDDRKANTGHYEQLAQWMRLITRQHKLPDMGEGQQAKRLNPTGNGYVEARDPDGQTANYQIGAELIYYQRGL